MPGPAQTPTIFVKAGDAGAVFSPDCQVALTACGYNPEDFGSYNHVQARIGRAREETAKAKEHGGMGRSEPKGFDQTSDEFVATCQSGHILQNARFQDGDEEGGRGDPCQNHYPLYSDDLAPCMPHSSYRPGSRGGARKGTLHHQVGKTDRENNEAALRDNEGLRDADGRTRMTNAQVDSARDDVVAVSLDHHLDNGDQPNSELPVAKEMKAKREAAVAAGKAKAAGMAKEIPDKEKREQVISNSRDIAADCIKAFCDAQLKHMRRQNKQHADENLAKAKAKNEAAKQEFAEQNGGKMPEGEPSQAIARAEADLAAKKKKGEDTGDAEAALKKWKNAERDEKSATCMKEQADRTDANSVRPYQARVPEGTRAPAPPQHNTAEEPNPSEGE